MAIKIDSNMSATAYHINDGPVLFPYSVDAQSAVSRFPGEWSADPWTAEDATAARQAIADQHARDVENAKVLDGPKRRWVIGPDLHHPFDAGLSCARAHEARICARRFSFCCCAQRAVISWLTMKSSGSAGPQT